MPHGAPAADACCMPAGCLPLLRQLLFGAADVLLRLSHVLLNRALELLAAVARRRADHFVHLALDLFREALGLVLRTVVADSHSDSPSDPARRDDELQSLQECKARAMPASPCVIKAAAC